MRRRLPTCLRKLWKIISTLFTIKDLISLGAGFLILLSLWLTDNWAMLGAYWRIFQDALNSSFVRGTPFRTAEGQWAVAFHLGGPPLFYVIWPLIFKSIAVGAGAPLIIYVTFKYVRYRLDLRSLKKTATRVTHHRSFKVSFRAVIVALILFAAGVTGMAIPPRIIMPLKASPDYVGDTLHLFMYTTMTIGRCAIIHVVPSTIDERSTIGSISCLIETPVSKLWNVSAIDVSTIIVNGTIRPFLVTTDYDGNGTAYLEATFYKSSLLPLLKTPSFLEFETATLTINGNMAGGYFFGKTQVRILVEHIGLPHRFKIPQ
jgi:hypothetical protein